MWTLTARPSVECRSHRARQEQRPPFLLPTPPPVTGLKLSMLVDTGPKITRKLSLLSRNALTEKKCLMASLSRHYLNETCAITLPFTALFETRVEQSAPFDAANPLVYSIERRGEAKVIFVESTLLRRPKLEPPAA